ncbi:hypothetical protein BDD12DRAFT_884988 [Trichophaea hybrida]|nr:hypothetical protein BDD12DRAFT_884988 [Trichophaea hybrida]
MPFNVDGSLQTQVRDQIQVMLLWRKQKSSPTAGASAVRIRLPNVRQQKQKTSPTAEVAANIPYTYTNIEGTGVEIEYRWVPSDEGIERNEKADEQAKAATERVEGTLELVKGYNGWSMATVQRRVTEAKWIGTEKWWKEKFNGKKVGYRMNEKRRMSKLLGETKKSVVGRFLQLKVGHALTGVYLERIKKNESNECWWCGHSMQTVDHLFKWFKKWRWQQDTLWEKLRKKCKMKERGRVPMAQVFDTEEAEMAMLKFLTVIDVGRVAVASGGNGQAGNEEGGMGKEGGKMCSVQREGKKEKGMIRHCSKRQQGTPDGHTGEVSRKRLR